MKKHTTLKRIIILIGVVIIPLAYSLFYLAAFWDPYSRLSSLPVAVVNLDMGAQVNGTQRNLGNEMVQRMKDGSDLRWIFTDAKEADRGLNGRTYYAVITIPENFSQNIASASTNQKAQAQILYSSNESRNFLASQILNKAILTLEEETRSKVNKELTQELSNKLGSVPNKLNELGDGLATIHDGADKLNNGAADLLSGTKDLSSGAADAHKGSSDLLSGANKLLDGAKDANAGAKSLDSGLGQLNSGAADLNTGLGAFVAGLQQAQSGAAMLNTGAQGTSALISGASQLKSGAAGLQTGVNQYVAGVNSLISQSQAVAQTLAAYVAANPSAATTLGPLLTQMSNSAGQLATLTHSGTALQSGVKQVADSSAALAAGAAGLTQLQSGASDLNAAMQKLLGGAQELKAGSGDLAAGLSGAKAGADKLAAGTAALASGASDLDKGAKDLDSGLKTLANGAADLNKGASDLKDGTGELLDGVGTAQTKVSDAINNAREELKSTDGLSSFAEKPVVVQNTPLNPVPNYGTAFAPYFMSLSLWVGAIIMFVGIYLDPDDRFPALGRTSNRRITRVAAFFGLGLVQSILLAAIVIHGLHLTVGNVWAFYGSCLLVSVVFTAIVEFMIVNLGDAGKFLALLFLILQLTACGGTFPMETVPTFFQQIYRYMPMTYSVNLFKDVIGNVDGGAHNALILTIMFAAFTAGTMVLDALRKTSRKRNAANAQAMETVEVK